MTEIRRSELRAAGRRLSGVVMRYGSTGITPWGQHERFSAGAFSWDDQVRLNVHHVRERALARIDRGLSLVDGDDALRMTADLPDTQEARDTLALIDNGVLSGLSVEFDAIQERQAGGVRVIDRAALRGLAVVDVPAYPASVVQEARRRAFEARRRGVGGVLRGVVPAARKLGCRCQKGDCDSVSFGPEAFGLYNPDIDPANADLLARARREVLAVHGDYDTPLAARSRGNLRLATTEDGGLSVEIDLDADTADAIKDSMAKAPVYVRPFMDRDRSSFVRDGSTAVYSDVQLRAVIVGSTDATDGLPEVTIEDMPAGRRRMMRW